MCQLNTKQVEYFGFQWWLAKAPESLAHAYPWQFWLDYKSQPKNNPEHLFSSWEPDFSFAVETYCEDRYG